MSWGDVVNFGSGAVGALGSALSGPLGGILGQAAGSFLSSGAQKDAAAQASQDRLAATNAALAAQQQNFNNGLNFQQNQFGQGLGFQQGLLGQAGGLGANQLNGLQNTFAPYVGAGNQAIGGLGQYAQAGLGGLQGQQAIAGLLGANAQQQAIAGIANSPQMAALTQRGENAILQNASATGGLRGGNVQAALAQFQPQMLSQLIDQQYARLGGLAGQGAGAIGQLGQLGQFGAGGLASGGLDIFGRQLGLAGQVGGNVANLNNQLSSNAGSLFGGLSSGVNDLLGQQGAIRAGNDLAQGQAQAGLYGGIGSNVNQWSLLNQLHGWGGLGAQPSAAPQGSSFLGGLNPYLAANSVGNVANAGNAGVSRAVGTLGNWGLF